MSGVDAHVVGAKHDHPGIECECVIRCRCGDLDRPVRLGPVPGLELGACEDEVVRLDDVIAVDREPRRRGLAVLRIEVELFRALAGGQEMRLTTDDAVRGRNDDQSRFPCVGKRQRDRNRREPTVGSPGGLTHGHLHVELHRLSAGHIEGGVGEVPDGDQRRDARDDRYLPRVNGSRAPRRAIKIAVTTPATSHADPHRQPRRQIPHRHLV